MKRLVPAIFFGGIVAFLLILVLAELTNVEEPTVPQPVNPKTDLSIDRTKPISSPAPRKDEQCDRVEAEFASMLAEAASCETDADCALANLDCKPPAVNRTFLEELYDLDKKRCHLSMPLCAGPVNEWQAVCVQLQCRVVDRRNGDAVNDMEQELMQEFRENLERNISIDMSDQFRSELEGSGLAEADIDDIVKELEESSADCFVNSLVQHAKTHGVPASSLIVEVEDEKGIAPVGLDFFELLDPCLNAARMEAGIVAE